MRIIRISLVTRVAALITLGSVCLYWLTAAQLPVNYADSDDLTLAGYYGGAAHPPGYALLTLLIQLGVSLSWLPAGQTAHFLSGLIQATANGLLFYVLYKLLKPITTNNINRLLAAGMATGLWALSLGVWQHAVIIEVFSLSYLLILLSWVLLLHSVVKDRVTIAAGGWFILGIACGFHPLNWIAALVTLGVFLAERRHSLTVQMLFKTLGLILVGWILTVLLPLLTQATKYSWLDSRSVDALIRFYLRDSYVLGGSQVETYAGIFSWNMMTNAVSHFFSYSLSHIGIVSIGLSLLGMGYLLVKRRWIGVGIIVGILLGGLGLAVYMNFPPSDSSPVEFWWGLQLRYRMFYLTSLFSIIGVSAGILWMLEIGVKQRLRYWLVGILLLVLAGLVSQNYSRVDVSESNFSFFYSKQILSDLPENAVFLVDSDMVFGFLYQQLVDQVRTDVEIVPLRIAPLQNIDRPLIAAEEKWEGEHTDRIMDLIRRRLQANDRIFIYDPEADLETKIGLEGNPFFAIPYGYVLEIALLPELHQQTYDFGLSVSLAGFMEPEIDYWTKGIKAHLAAQHIRLGYYAARIGDTAQATLHTQIAEQLTPTEAVLLDYQALVNQGSSRHDRLNSYLIYTIPPPEEYWQKAQEVRATNPQAYEYFLTRLWLRYPGHLAVYDALAELAESKQNPIQAAWYRELKQALY